jgi:hypothetical protein
MPVIMTWAGRFLVPKKNVNPTVSTAPQIKTRDNAGCKVKPGAAGLDDRIELREHLPKNCWLSRSVLHHAHGGGIERVERQCHFAAFLFGRHQRPVPIDRKPKVVANGRPCRDRCGLWTSSEPIECRGGSGLTDHRGLSITKLLPRGDHGEGEKHRVDHTDCGELEARDLIVAGQSLETDPAAHQNWSAHGGDRGEDHQQDRRDPQRKSGQEE